MKQTFTKLFSAGLIVVSALTGLTATAQQTTLASVNTLKTKTEVPADSAAVDKKAPTAPKADPAAWVPTRRLWGYAFGDLYFNQHADATNRGAETMYNGVPSNRNAFHK